MRRGRRRKKGRKSEFSFFELLNFIKCTIPFYELDFVVGAWEIVRKKE